MKTIQLLCLTLLVTLTLTACVGQTIPPFGQPTTSSTGTHTTIDSRTTDISGTTTQETAEISAEDSTTTSAHASASRSIENTTVTTAMQTKTTAVTTTKKIKTTNKPTTTAKKPTTTTRKLTTITTGTVTIAQYESEVLRLVNIERAARGLAAVSAGSSAAMQAADVRADEIKTSFSHTRPNGSSCFTALEEAGVHYHAAGENIAYGYQTPAAVVEGWMNSPGHRSNILDATFTHLAVGYDNNNWVQLFYA